MIEAKKIPDKEIVEDNLTSIGKQILIEMLKNEGIEITPEIQNKINKVIITTSLKKVFSLTNGTSHQFTTRDKVTTSLVARVLGGSFRTDGDNLTIIYINPITKLTRWRPLKKILLHELQHAADEIVQSSSESNIAPAEKLLITVSLQFLLFIIYQIQILPEIGNDFIHIFQFTLIPAAIYFLRQITKSEKEQKAKAAEKLTSNDNFALILKQLK